MISKTDYIVNLKDTIMIFILTKTINIFFLKQNFEIFKRQYYVSINKT